MRINH